MPVRNAIGTAIAVLTISAALPAGKLAHALGPDGYIGQVGLVSATYCPRGTIEADGRVLEAQSYNALYILIGNAYGGDGSKYTFALPDLRTKVPAKGLLYCIVVEGIYPSKSAQ
jgi:microcystin-dependent protein